jgi:hypothetical protein
MPDLSDFVRRPRAWSTTKFVCITTPVVFALGVGIDLALGGVFNTAITQAGIFALIWVVGFTVGGIVERSVYRHGRR